MSGELIAALTALAQRLAQLAAGDEELRRQLHELALAAAKATEGPSTAPPPAGALELPSPLATVSSDAVPAPPEGTVLAGESLGEPLDAATLAAMLTLGRRADGDAHNGGRTAAARTALQRPELPDLDLALIEKRCRLKAEGSRWAAARQRLFASGADFRTQIEPKDREIIEQAKAIPDCFLWMNHPSGPSPEDLSLWEDLAGCFDAVASALALVRAAQADLDNQREVFEPALDLVAEAQSALRQAFLRMDVPRDTDQSAVFNWLKETAARQHVFIQRYMRADDPANPAGWTDIIARIDKLDERLRYARDREKRQRSRVNRIRYHLKRISDGGTEHDWRTIARTLDEMVGDGIPPSNREVRELLLPVLDDWPDLSELPQGCMLVLREIDRFKAQQAPQAEMRAAAAPSPDVVQVSRLLQGRSAVLIGGDRRPNAHQALKTALGLAELEWIETREHESLEPFEAYVARPDVALVLLAIRWASHSYGDVKMYCEKHGKPLVRLPGGYNPNQVAAQVLAQCSQRLMSAAPSA